jgi:hypothetical protein
VSEGAQRWDAPIYVAKKINNLILVSSREADIGSRFPDSREVARIVRIVRICTLTCGDDGNLLSASLSALSAFGATKAVGRCV